ncbi:MAG: winged helix-turn-helix domain-containing protein [Gemmataceae bacterium]
MATKKTKANIRAAKVTEAMKSAKAQNAKAPGKRVKASAETKKPSALDAAARVLAGTSQPMNSTELVDKMAAKGYWTSPGGKTPHATLHAAISREIKVKGAESRFAKVGPGKFTASGK